MGLRVTPVGPRNRPWRLSPTPVRSFLVYEAAPEFLFIPMTGRHVVQQIPLLTRAGEE